MIDINEMFDTVLQSTDLNIWKNLPLSFPNETGTSTIYRQYQVVPTSETGQARIVESNLQLTIQLLSDVQKLTAEVKKLRDELADRPLVSSIVLHSLNDSKLTMIKPISIIVEEAREEVLVRWPEVNAYGIGATISEAIHNLKNNISDLFLDLLSRKPETLGEIAIDTLNIFNTYIKDKK